MDVLDPGGRCHVCKRERLPDGPVHPRHQDELRDCRAALDWSWQFFPVLEEDLVRGEDGKSETPEASMWPSVGA